MSETGNERVQSDEASELWAFDDDGGRITYVYDMNERAPGSGAVKSKAPLLGTILGAIDPSIVQDMYGGGNYRIISKCGGSVTTRYLAVAGLPKNRSTAVEAPSAPPAAPSTPALDVDALASRIAESVARAVAAAMPAPAQPSMSFEMMLQLFDRMRPAETEKAAALSLIEMWEKGAKAASAATGGRTIGDAFVESLPAMVETVDKVLTARAAAVQRPVIVRTVPPRVVPTPAGAAPADAEVSSSAQPAAAAPAPETSADEAAMDLLVVAGMVDRALRLGTSAEDFADALEIHAPDQVPQLRELDPKLVVAMVRTHVQTFPRLADRTAEDFIARVVAVLGEDDGDSESPDA